MEQKQINIKIFFELFFYPIIKCIDYEKIDNIILIEEMKTNFGKYYSNFKSVNLYNDKDERKEFI